MLEKVVLWLTIITRFQIQKLVKARTTLPFLAVRVYRNEEIRIEKACSMYLRVRQ